MPRNIMNAYITWLVYPTDANLKILKKTVFDYVYIDTKGVVLKGIAKALKSGGKRDVIVEFHKEIRKEAHRAGHDEGYQEGKMDFRFPRGGMG